MALSPYSADEARFLFEISGIELKVLDFTASERVSMPFDVQLTLGSDEEIDFDDVVGKPAWLTILGAEKERYFHGIVNRFVQTGIRGRFILYSASLVPTIWLLSLEQDCRIFQNMKVENIVAQILDESGITSDLFDFRLKETYTERAYCVQYRETDLNFISRLLEEEGIFYFFEHTIDNHRLIFADSTVCYQPIEGEKNAEGKTEIQFQPSGGLVQDEEVVVSFIYSKQIRSGKVTLKDFNFTKPALDLTAKEEDESYKEREIYDYPGEYYDEERGKTLSKIYLQEAIRFTEKAEGRSDCPHFVPGFTFTLIEHDRDEFNNEFFLVDVVHSGSQPQVLEEDAGAGGFSYANQFFGVPATVTFRPGRITPKPIVEGVQTAIVVGPSGEEIYTDEHGRVKVQFHWDREGQNDEKSSCWIRVSQVWAGVGWGAMFIPRIDHEVVVDFVEGDPDRPLITGRVYHGTNTPPYTLPDEKTKSTIKSDSSIGGGGSNEFRFEDKKDSEEIYLHGQKDWTIAIENDKNQTIGNNETLSVGVEKSDSIGANKSISVGANHTESIGANMSLTVGSNKSETVSIASTETVGAAKALTIGAAYQVSVGAAMNETVGGAKMEEVGAYRMESVGGKKTEKIGGEKNLSTGKDYSIAVGKNMGIAVKEKGSLSVKNELDIGTEKSLTIKAKESILIQSDKDITIKAGKAQLILKKDGKVDIKGNKINIKGSGDVKIKGSKVSIN